MTTVDIAHAARATLGEYPPMSAEEQRRIRADIEGRQDDPGADVAVDASVTGLVDAPFAGGSI